MSVLTLKSVAVIEVREPTIQASKPIVGDISKFLQSERSDGLDQSTLAFANSSRCFVQYLGSIFLSILNFVENIRVI